VIELTPCDEARRQCQAFGLPTEALRLRLRLVRVRLKGGEEEFLITSLLDEEAFLTQASKEKKTSQRNGQKKEDELVGID